MQIDRATGAAEVPELGVVRTSATLRAEWSASAAGRGSRVGVENGPWCSYDSEAFTDAGTPWRLGAWFHGQRLWRVTLVACNAEFGAGWDEWSAAKEEARRIFQDRWLTRVVGGEPRFAWGSVASIFDARGGGSSIILDYGSRPG